MIATNIDFSIGFGAPDNWTAFTKKCKPDTITIIKHPIWLQGDEEKINRLVLKMLSHEPIHQILWRDEGLFISKTNRSLWK